MTDIRDKIADAILESQIGFRMELIRLVDGVNTYRLTYDDGEKLEFIDDDCSEAIDALYAHVAARKRYAQADAVLAAIGLPIPPQDREEKP